MSQLVKKRVLVHLSLLYLPWQCTRTPSPQHLVDVLNNLGNFATTNTAVHKTQSHPPLLLPNFSPASLYLSVVTIATTLARSQQPKQHCNHQHPHHKRSHPASRFTPHFCTCVAFTLVRSDQRHACTISTTNATLQPQQLHNKQSHPLTPPTVARAVSLSLRGYDNHHHPTQRVPRERRGQLGGDGEIGGEARGCGVRPPGRKFGAAAGVRLDPVLARPGEAWLSTF